jgi:cyclopropane fatty-acyl-phospholipid synthase-like methyltransferase
MEFWETAFLDKQLMWGEASTNTAHAAVRLFKENGFQNILIPGFGYGRNAKPFFDAGFKVAGIEISRTAINLSRKFLGFNADIFEGSVDDMPFDSNEYDGIFCHALIHLLGTEKRSLFISRCFSQLKLNGIMIFTAITKHAPTYGIGECISTDTFKTKDGVNLFFYDEQAIKTEFENFGLIESSIVEEQPSTKFWKIICEKNTAGQRLNSSL